MVQRPPAGTIPDTPGSYQFKDARRPGDLRRQGASLRQRLSQLLPEPAQPAPAHRARWWRPPRRRVDPGPQRRRGADARVQRSSSSTSRASTSGCATTRATRSSPSPSTTSGPGPMVMRGRKRKGVRYFGPYGHAYAIRETLDLLLRTLPDPHLLATTSSTSTSGSAGRACCSTSRSARARASARSTQEAVRRARRGAAASSSTATPTPIVQRLETRDARGGRRARVRAGRPPARPAHQRAARRSRSSRWWPSATRTSTCIGIADDELEAAVQVFFVRKGRVVGRKGFIVDKVEDLTPGELVDTHPRGALRRRAAAGRARSRCSCRSSPTTSTLYEEWLTASAGLEGARSGCRSGATSASCRRPSPATPRRSSSATACAGPPTTTAGPGRSTSCRSTSACPRRRCASSATT